jgi:hypothetical protein
MVRLFGLRSLMEPFSKAQSLGARTSVILLVQTRVLEKQTSLVRILAVRASSALGSKKLRFQTVSSMACPFGTPEWPVHRSRTLS